MPYYFANNKKNKAKRDNSEHLSTVTSPKSPSPKNTSSIEAVGVTTTKSGESAALTTNRTGRVPRR